MQFRFDVRELRVIAGHQGIKAGGEVTGDGVDDLVLFLNTNGQAWRAHLLPHPDTGVFVRGGPAHRGPNEAAEQMPGMWIRHLKHFRVPLDAHQKRLPVTLHGLNEPIVGNGRCDQPRAELLDALMVHAVDRRPCGFKQSRQLCVGRDLDFVREVIALEAGGWKKVMLVESRIL